MSLVKRVKSALRRFKIYLFLASLWRKVRAVRHEFVFVRLKSLVSSISSSPDFPFSAASLDQLLSLSIRGYNESIPSLVEVAELSNLNQKSLIFQLDEHFPADSASLELRKILDHHGSDKGSTHRYDQIYTRILKSLPSHNVTILEVGLGSNDSEIPSNMGSMAIPGASLRAWSEYVPTAEVVGVDIDSTILFAEERISTFQLDQTSRESWDNLKARLKGKQFDLVIDDGLHSPLANLRTLIEISPLIKESGYLVVEDVPERAVPVWILVSHLLGPQWQVQIIKTPVCFAVTLKNLNSQEDFQL